jgi:hypothetical protein
MHRVRDRPLQRRTARLDEIRGFLLERGITFPTQPIHLRKNLPTVVGDCESETDPSTGVGCYIGCGKSGSKRRPILRPLRMSLTALAPWTSAASDYVRFPALGCWSLRPCWRLSVTARSVTPKGRFRGVGWRCASAVLH